MKKSSILAIATALLLMTGGVALAEQHAAESAPDAEAAAAAKAAADGVGDADCNKVFTAKAVADKGMSPKHLSEKLGLPIDKVNSCLLLLRRAPAPPAAE